jgi:hypothetical protein
MTIKTGTDEDHALLMASIFRTVKFEDQMEFKNFAVEMKKKTVTKKDRDKDLLTVEVKGGDNKEGDEEEKGDKEEKEGDEKAAGATPTPDATATPAETKKGGLGGLGGLGGKKEEEEEI